MNRHLLRRALIGGTIALVSTCVAALAYGAFDTGIWSPAILIYAPLGQSLVVGLVAGLVLGSVRQRFRLMSFAILSLFIGGLLGFAVGEIWIGYSPHFSRDLAIVFLAATWTVGASIGAGIVGFLSPASRIAAA